METHFFLLHLKFVEMKKFLQIWPSINRTHKKVFSSILILEKIIGKDSFA